MPLFERALAIRRRTLGEDHRRCRRNAVLAGRQPGPSSVNIAEPWPFPQGDGIWEKAQRRRPPGFVRSLLAQAAVLSAQGRDRRFARRVRPRLTNSVAVLGPSHPDIAAIEVKRAAILAQIDRKQESLTVALAAEATGRQHLSLTLGSLPERQALDYAAKRPQGLGLALSLVTADSSASVLDAVVRGRSLVLDEMAMRRRAVNDEAVGPAASLWTTLRQARERLANLVIRGPGSLRRNSTRLSSLRRSRRKKTRSGHWESRVRRSARKCLVQPSVSTRSGSACRRTARSCPWFDTTARCSLRCHRP